MLDQRIRAAITSAAAEAGQPNLADKLIAWLEELASGNTTLEDRDATRRHLDLLYETVTIRRPNAADAARDS